MKPPENTRASRKGVLHLAARFADVIDSKSLYTKGKSARVAALAQQLAEAVGFSPDHVFLIRLAALLRPDPWIAAAERCTKNSIVKGKVTKYNPFGAFVAIEDSVQGLAHISEFGAEAKMKEELELGKTYDFRVISIEPKEHRLSLSLKLTAPAEPEEAKPDKPAPEEIKEAAPEQTPNADATPIADETVKEEAETAAETETAAG